MKKRLLLFLLVLAMLSSLFISPAFISEAVVQTGDINISDYEGNILRENTRSITASIPCSHTTYHSPERMIDGSFSGDDYYKSTNTMDDYTDLVITVNLSGYYNIGQVKIYERYISRYGVCSDSVTVRAGTPNDMTTVISDGKLSSYSENDVAQNTFSFYPAVLANTIEITFAGTRSRGTNGECTYQIWEIEAYTGANYGLIMYEGSPKAKVGADVCRIDENNENAVPEIKDGVFSAPAEFLAKSLGLSYSAEGMNVKFTYNGKSVSFTEDEGVYSKYGHIYVPAPAVCKGLGINCESDACGLFFADFTTDIDWNDKNDFLTLSELIRDVIYETPPTPEAVITQLKNNNPANKHPRLFFSEDMPVRELRRRIKYEPYKSWANDIILRAESCISKLEADPIEYEISDGVRLISVCERVLDSVENIGFAYMMTGDTKYADKVKETILTVCSFPDWNSKHFLDVGTMSAAVALGYDWCYDNFTDNEKIAVKNALINYALKPVMDDYNEVAGRVRTFKWSSKTTDAYPNNWISICTAGTIMAALAIGDEDMGEFSDAGTVVTEGIERLKDLADTYLPDGGFMDGPHYWDYAMDYMGRSIGSMLTALGTDYGLYKSPGFNVTFEWLAQITGPCGAFNFDSADTSYADSSEFFLFGKLTGKEELINHRLNQQLGKYAMAPAYKDILWYDEEITNELDLSLDYHSRGATNLSVLKTGSADSDTWAAIYGGYRKKASGAMQDFDGTFVFDMSGKRWALDYGAEGQTYYSTGNKFTDYYICRPEGHNTVIISESEDSGHDSDACGQLINSMSNDRMGIAVYDLTDQLDDYGAQSWTRGMKLDRAINKITIQDELELSTEAPFYWFMHTEADIEITDGGKGAILTLGTDKIKASLVSDDESLVMTVMNPDPLPSSPNPSNQESRAGTRKLVVHSDSVTGVNMAVEFVPYFDTEILPDTFTPMSDWELGGNAVFVNGSYSGKNGAGEYLPGDAVTVDAGTRSGVRFDRWIAEGIVLDDPCNPVQTFIMPDNSVKLSAKWSLCFFDINFDNWTQCDDFLNSDGTDSGYYWYNGISQADAELVADSTRTSPGLKLTMKSTMSSYIDAYTYMDSSYRAFPEDKVVWGEFSVKFEGQFVAVGYDHAQGVSPICISSDGMIRRFDWNARRNPIKGDKADMYQLELGKWYHIVWAMDCRNAPSGDGGPLYAWVNGTKIINGTDYSSAFKTGQDNVEYLKYYRLYAEKPKTGNATVYFDNLKGYTTFELDDHASSDFKKALQTTDRCIEYLGKVYVPRFTRVSELTEGLSSQSMAITRDGIRLSDSDTVLEGDTVHVDDSTGVGFWDYEVVPIDACEMIEDSIYHEDDRFYAEFINLSDEEINAKLITAVYDGSKLAAVCDLKDITVVPGKSEIESGYISFAESGKSYKVFVFGSKEKLKPLCKSKSFTR